MQTFLPYADFEASARVLDTKRLGKQRVEVIQVVRGLTVPGYAWAQHPATLMWRGYEEALGRYGLTVCEVWVERGFGDTCAATIVTDLATFGVSVIRPYAELAAADALPPWLAGDEVRTSHRSALVRKDPDHYRPVFPDVPDDLAYVWPVRSAATIEREQRQIASARKRQERAEQQVLAAQEAARRRRSAAAKKAAVTRAANAKARPNST